MCSTKKLAKSGNFLFEFEILCGSYGNLLNNKKWTLFYATLKDGALKSFMSWGMNSIISWSEMQNIFLEKYNDNYLKEEIFKMNKNEDEIVEDLIERFM